MSEQLLAGVDQAWRGDRNPTAIAWGSLCGSRLDVFDIQQNLYGVSHIYDALSARGDLYGVAIDAPLVITNQNGQRPCERQVGRDYGARHAGCHPSNLSLYPDADSVLLAGKLEGLGFSHVGDPSGKWMIECYPHPALIECFGLEVRHPYKKGAVNERREGQVQLAQMLLSLSGSSVLQMHVSGNNVKLFKKDNIATLRGRELKHNEDALDAIMCLYIAALYQREVAASLYGNESEGYIYIPQVQCI